MIEQFILSHHSLLSSIHPMNNYYDCDAINDVRYMDKVNEKIKIPFLLSSLSALRDPSRAHSSPSAEPP